MPLHRIASTRRPFDAKQNNLRSRRRCWPPVAKLAGVMVCLCWLIPGCTSRQYGHLLTTSDMPSSQAADEGIWNPLVDEAVAGLLSRCPTSVQPVTFENSHAHAGTISAKNTSIAADSAVLNSPIVDPVTGMPIGPVVTTAPLALGPANVCFVGIDYQGEEEPLSFKGPLYQRIESQIEYADSFRVISRSFVDATLNETRLRADTLSLPSNRVRFATAMGAHGNPIDYLLFATVTNVAADPNSRSQHDYLLTLEMVNVHTGRSAKQTTKLQKEHSKMGVGSWWSHGA